MNTPSYQINQN